MNAVVIKPKTVSDMQFFLDFAKRIGAPAKTIDTKELEDAYFASLIEKGLTTPSVSRREVMNVLK